MLEEPPPRLYSRNIPGRARILDSGFGYKTTLVLLTHLWVTYGEIDDDMLADNLDHIKTHV